MKPRRRKLARTLVWATSVGGALTVASAPTNPADVAVEVTGSNIKRVLTEGALPVQTITREAIARSGAQTAYEVLDHISAAMSYGGINEQTSIPRAGGRFSRAGLPAMPAQMDADGIAKVRLPELFRNGFRCNAG